MFFAVSFRGYLKEMYPSGCFGRSLPFITIHGETTLRLAGPRGLFRCRWCKVDPMADRCVTGIIWR